MNQKWKVVFLQAVSAVSLMNALGVDTPAHAQQGVNVLNTNPNGSTTMASSSPVTLPTDQFWAFARAINSAVPATALFMECQSMTGELSTTTNGSTQAFLCGLEGKQVILPYSVKENMVRGTASTVATTLTNIIASASGFKLYITDVECSRLDAGTTAAFVTFNDNATTLVVLPNNGGGGGFTKSFETPLVTALGSAFAFTTSVAISTVSCSAQGYKGT